MISIPVTNFSSANSIRVVLAVEESNNAPGVMKENRWVFSAGMCFEHQQPSLVPRKTETKVMVSSKKGQSSRSEVRWLTRRQLAVVIKGAAECRYAGRTTYDSNGTVREISIHPAPHD